MNSKNFLKASSILFIGELLTRFIGFAYLKPLNSINDEIGFISGIIMQPYSFFLVFAMLGLTNVLTIKLSKSYNKAELYKKNFFDGALYILLTSILITVLLMIFSPQLIKQTSGDIYYLNSLVTSLRILSLSIIFYAFNMLLKSTFFSQSKYTIVSVTYVTEQLIKVFLLLIGCYIFLVKYDFSVSISSYIISISTFISILSTTIIMIVYGFKNNVFEPLKVKIKYKLKLKSFVTLFSLGIIYFVNGLFITGFMQIDISNMMNNIQSFGYSSYEAVSIFGTYTTWSWKLISLVLSLGSVFVTVMVKHLSDKKGNSNSEFNYILNILLIYSLLATTFFLTAGKYFYLWFYTNSNAMSIFILFSQSLIIPFYLLRIQMSVYAITENRKKSIILSTAVMFILKLILNPIFFHFFFILGYSLASIVAISISTFMLVRLNKKLFSFSKKEILYKVSIVIKMAIVLIATVVLYRLTYNIFNIESASYFWQMILQSLILLSCFALVLYKDIKRLL